MAAYSSSSSDDEDDAIPLSQLLRFPKIPKTSKKFKENDIVFANTSPYTWSPAQITTITNNNSNTASISLFKNTHKTHDLKLSQICDFEDNFIHMVKRVNAKLSDEIDVALEELGQRAALGMICSCRINPSVEPIGLVNDFEPKEMMGFVRDMAVCAWVGVDEIVKAVRLSAQVNGYRHYVSVCRTSGVDEEFCLGNLLGFVKNVAVCWGGDEWENASVGDEVGQIDAYRRFVSLRPDWMYRQSLEIEDGSDSEESEGNEQDTSDFWSVGETECGVTCELEDDSFSTELPKEDCEMYQEQVLEGREICDTNRADFCILDLDNEYESMMNNPLEPVPNCIVSPKEDNLINENTEMDNVCPSSSSQESDIYVEIACNRNLPCVTDTGQMAANGTESLVNEEPANRVLETVELRSGMGRVLDITFDNDKSNVESISTIDERLIRVTLTDFLLEYTTCVGDKIPESPSHECQVHPCDENAKLQSSPKNIVSTRHGKQNGIVDIISSASQMEASEEPVVKKRRFEHDNTLPESAFCLGGQLVRDLASESQILSPNQSFNEYAAVSNGDDADQYENMETNSCSISQKEAVERSVVKRRRWDMATAPNESNLQNSVASSSRKIGYSTCENRHPSSASDKILSHDENVVASNLNDGAPCSKENVTRRIEGGNNFKPAPSYNLPKHTSIGILHKSKKRYHHNVSDLSDWCRFYASPLTKDETKSPNKPRNSYVSPLTRHAGKLSSRVRKSYASPLTRDGTKSPSKARKSSLDDRALRSFPKSLHMKFPRDFTLPSKQELEKKFGIFGPLDHSRTKVYTFTGAAQVVFLSRASSYAAYEYAKKKNVFGQGNVRFWIDEYENYRKVVHVKSTAEYSSLNLKSCLKKRERDKKEKYNVRFQIPAS